MTSLHSSRSRDHPRVCGEKFFAPPVLRLIQGSPPRVRGKGLQTPAGTGAMGITPACAGKRITDDVLHFFVRDHPRVCGEKLFGQLLARTNEGSPPRVRGKAGSCAITARPIGITPACAGKREGKGPAGDQDGITPACAGKSSGTPSAARRAWDHPRVRGEKP